MKLRQTLLIAAMALFAASGLMAKEQTKKTEIPGVAPQPAEFFYTGKPYDADLGAYTFNYRNYDPELKRWTSMDPSGFPDGTNCYKYVNDPMSQFDPDGLYTQSYSLLLATDSGGNLNITFDVNYDKSGISIAGGGVMLTGQTSGSKNYGSYTISFTSDKESASIASSSLATSTTGQSFWTFSVQTYARINVTSSTQASVGFSKFGLNFSLGGGASTTDSQRLSKTVSLYTEQFE